MPRLNQPLTAQQLAQIEEWEQNYADRDHLEEIEAARAASTMREQVEIIRQRQLQDRADGLLNGDLSPRIMAMIGVVPVEAPTGFQLRKIEYSVQLDACTDFVAGYRLDGRNQGKICMISTGNRSYKNINDDGAGGSGITSDHKLLAGDIIIGAVLRVSDGRNESTRTGTIAAGIVPVAQLEAETATGTSGVSDTTLQMYGKFSTPRTTITSECIGTSLTGPCNHISQFGVVDFAHNPAFYKTVDLDTAANSYADFADPVLTVSVQGIATPADATNVIVHLSVYALLGPRDGQHNIPNRSGSSTLKCFENMILPSPSGPTFSTLNPGLREAHYD